MMAAAAGKIWDNHFWEGKTVTCRIQESKQCSEAPNNNSHLSQELMNTTSTFFLPSQLLGTLRLTVNLRNYQNITLFFKEFDFLVSR